MELRGPVSDPTRPARKRVRRREGVVFPGRSSRFSGKLWERIIAANAQLSTFALLAYDELSSLKL